MHYFNSFLSIVCFFFSAEDRESGLLMEPAGWSKVCLSRPQAIGDCERGKPRCSSLLPLVGSVPHCHAWWKERGWGSSNRLICYSKGIKVEVPCLCSVSWPLQLSIKVNIYKRTSLVPSSGSTKKDTVTDSSLFVTSSLSPGRGALLSSSVSRWGRSGYRSKKLRVCVPLTHTREHHSRRDGKTSHLWTSGCSWLQ